MKYNTYLKPNTVGGCVPNEAIIATFVSFIHLKHRVLLIRQTHLPLLSEPDCPADLF